MNLDDLRKQAEEADIDPTEAPSNSQWSPQDGETYTVRPIEVKRVLSSKNNDGVSLRVEVVDGPDGINRSIFLNYHFTAAMHANNIKRNLHYLDILGVEMDAYDHVKPEGQGWKSGAVLPFDDMTVVQLNAAYRANKDKPESPWPNHHLVEVASGPSNTVVVPEDDGDEDPDWDQD